MLLTYTEFRVVNWIVCVFCPRKREVQEMLLEKPPSDHLCFPGCAALYLLSSRRVTSPVLVDTSL